MSAINNVIGTRVKRKRRELGITRYELGRILGCTQQKIQNYETGYSSIPLVTLNDFAKLCKFLFDWFLLNEIELLVIMVDL